MRVLVTGGSGFIGTNAVDALLARGDDPVNIDIRPPRNAEQGDHYRKVDLRNREALIREVAALRPDSVLHLGARTDLDGTSVTSDYTTNVEGVSNLIAAIDAAGSVRHVIFASTRLVHPIGYAPRHDFDYRPPNAYGESKVVGELIVRRSGPREASWTIVRPTSVWGPWMEDPNDQFFRMIQRGLYVHAGSLNPPKQYSYVENGVVQLLELLEAPRAEVHGQVYYLADYEPLRLRDWADEIQRQTGARPIRTVPVPLLRLAAMAGDIIAPVWRGVPLTSFRWANMTASVTFDMRALARVAPDLPISMPEGVGRTITWMREHGQL